MVSSDLYYENQTVRLIENVLDVSISLTDIVTFSFGNNCNGIQINFFFFKQKYYIETWYSLFCFLPQLFYLPYLSSKLFICY